MLSAGLGQKQLFEKRRLLQKCFRRSCQVTRRVKNPTGLEEAGVREPSYTELFRHANLAETWYATGPDRKGYLTKQPTEPCYYMKYVFKCSVPLRCQNP